MALWIPDPEKIGNSEYIGRRLFDQPQLVGASDQKPFHGLEISHFEEKRGDQFSVDRLGRSSVDKAVIKFLRPLATTAAQSFRKTKSFDGWITIPSQKATKPSKGPALPLIASPEGENRYHAHLLTTEIIANNVATGHYLAALHLREVFTAQGSQLFRPSPESEDPANGGQTSLAKVWQVAARALPFLQKIFSKASKPGA